MREIAVLSWCSICYRDDGEKVEADFDEVVGVGDLHRLIQLCQKHLLEVNMSELGVVLDTYGDPPEANLKPSRVAKSKPPKQTKTVAAGTSTKPLVTCEWCGTEASLGTSISAHVRAFHPEHYIEFMANNALKDRSGWQARLARGEVWTPVKRRAS